MERTIAAKAMIGGRTSAGLEMTATSGEIARGIAAKRVAGRAIAGSADEDGKSPPGVSGRAFGYPGIPYAGLRAGTVIFTVLPFSPGKLVNIASIRFGTSRGSSFERLRARAWPSNSDWPSLARRMSSSRNEV